MSSLRKDYEGFRYPITNNRLFGDNKPNNPVKIGRMMLEDIDRFVPREVEVKVIELWNAGLHIEDIAKEVGWDDVDRVNLLLIDLARKEKIQYREGGVYGNSRSNRH